MSDNRQFWRRQFPTACLIGAIIGGLAGYLQVTHQIGNPYVIMSLFLGFFVLLATLIVGIRDSRQQPGVNDE